MLLKVICAGQHFHKKNLTKLYPLMMSLYTGISIDKIFLNHWINKMFLKLVFSVGALLSHWYILFVFFSMKNEQIELFWQVGHLGLRQGKPSFSAVGMSLNILMCIKLIVLTERRTNEQLCTILISAQPSPNCVLWGKIRHCTVFVLHCSENCHAEWQLCNCIINDRYKCCHLNPVPIVVPLQNK